MKGSKYILKDKTERGYCSRCGKYYKIIEAPVREGRVFCPIHNCQLRLKRRKRDESKVFRY